MVIIMQTTSSGILFQEFSSLGPGRLSMFGLGVLVVLFGVYRLATRDVKKDTGQGGGVGERRTVGSGCRLPSLHGWPHSAQIGALQPFPTTALPPSLCPHYALRSGDVAEMAQTLVPDDVKRVARSPRALWRDARFKVMGAGRKKRYEMIRKWRAGSSTTFTIAGGL